MAGAVSSESYLQSDFIDSKKKPQGLILKLFKVALLTIWSLCYSFLQGLKLTEPRTAMGLSAAHVDPPLRTLQMEKED